MIEGAFRIEDTERAVVEFVMGLAVGLADFEIEECLASVGKKAETGTVIALEKVGSLAESFVAFAFVADTFAVLVFERVDGTAAGRVTALVSFEVDRGSNWLDTVCRPLPCFLACVALVPVCLVG